MFAPMPRRRKTDIYDDSCPMTPKQIEVMITNQKQLMEEMQIEVMITNQKQLMEEMADIKKYLFAGRVVIGTLVFIGISFDWFRDHMTFIKAWITK